MLTVGLLGKKYEDHLLTIKSLLEGETNICDCFKNRLGGIYNFLRVPVKNVNFKRVTEKGQFQPNGPNDVEPRYDVGHGEAEYTKCYQCRHLLDNRQCF